MFKNIKIQFSLLMLLLLSWSCVNDEGNYNYTDINEAVVTGISEEYTVYSNENFKITPTVVFTQDDNTSSNRYSYQWMAVNPAKNGAEAKTIFSTAKDLDILLKLAPGKYDVYYSIKDNETGVTWKPKPFILNVVNTIYEGWLAIGDDTEGKARLDMISLVPGITEPRIINDVLNHIGSPLKLSGKAVDVSTFYNPITTTTNTTIYGIYVTATESGTSRLEENTFDWKQTQNIAYETTIAVDFPTNFAVDFMKSPTGGENFIYSKGNIYYFNKSQSIKYGLPINATSDNKTFYAAPFIAEAYPFTSTTSTGIPLFYDMIGRRFLRYSPSAGCTAPATGTKLNWNNTNSDLVYMTTSYYNDNEVFAVLKNITTANKYFLLRCSKTLVQTYYEEMLVAPDLDKATKFAVSPVSGYLFYAVGGKLYEYDHGTKSAKLMLDKGAEQITYIGFHPNAKTSSKTDSKDYSSDLVVGSYGTTGKLEIFGVPSVNRPLDLKNTYNGLCRIVDVAFRSRN